MTKIIRAQRGDPGKPHISDFNFIGQRQKDTKNCLFLFGFFFLLFFVCPIPPVPTPLLLRSASRNSPRVFLIITLLRLFRLTRSSRSARAVLPALVILLCATILTAQPPRSGVA